MYSVQYFYTGIA